MGATDDVIDDDKRQQAILVGVQTDGTPTKVLCDSSGRLRMSLTDADADTKIQVEEGTDDDTVRIDAGGVEVAVFKATEVVINDGSSATVDFRAEGDTNANLLFVDASVDAVGIGTGSPDTNAVLDVEGSIALDEISAPTATANRGKIWTQTDNNMYFQDGAATNTVLLKGGLHSIWVPAEAITPRDNAGCADLATTAAATSGRPDIRALGFDTSSDEHAQFTIAMPKMWNGGTVTAVFYWTAASGSGTVQWAIQGISLSEGDAIDTAFGTAVLPAVDTLTTAKDVHISATTGAITIAGTPAAEDLSCFQVYRDVSGDNLGVDALLLGVKIFYTIDSGNDA